MEALLDADILVYRIGYTTEQEDIEIAKWRMNDLVERILADTKATSFKCFLTESQDSTAFRKEVYPQYKANRKQPKPVHYEVLRDFLCDIWEAQVVRTIEADDAIGINHNQNSIIVSIDKDLNMIPGKHYNFVKEIMYDVTEEEGIRNFYTQLLMGDTADNVQGIKGIGPKTADKILSGATTESELFERVRKTYNNDKEMSATGEVLWILRNEYPYGRWSYTPFGSRLEQDLENQSLLDMNQTQLGLAYTGEGISISGSPPNGTNHLEDSIILNENQI